MLTRPLEDDWQDVLDAVAKARRWPTSRDVARLGEKVAALSRAYNEEGTAGGDEALAARLGFSFARDVPKGAGAVRELVAAGLVTGDPLRVLDVGAGMGATTFGVARALAASGRRPLIQATWVDTDARALEVGQAIVRGRADNVRVERLLPEASRASGRFELVLVGQVLSEMDRELGEEARAERHAAWLRGLLDDRVTDDGALVVIEPALRDRTRHLHRVRDRLVAGGVTLFAPCLHADACPALQKEGDWCHEDLDVDLPAWLVPVARAAGLRYQGLTFSYLVLRKDGRTLAAARPRALRVVSDAIVTKGKREAFLCGALGEAGETGVRVRAMRLDRDRNAKSHAWDEARKGDILTFEPPLDPARPRITKETEVSRGRDPDDDRLTK